MCKFRLLIRYVKGLSTRKAGRGHATPHMPVETAKCWWLLKIEPNAWAGGKGSCSVCVDLQAVGALEFFGELYSLAKGFGPIFEGVWAGSRDREGSIFSNHQHFTVSTGICRVACPLPASRVDKPLVMFKIMVSAKKTLFIQGISWIKRGIPWNSLDLPTPMNTVALLLGLGCVGREFRLAASSGRP